MSVPNTSHINKDFESLPTQEKTMGQETRQELANRSAGIVVVRYDEDAREYLVLMLRAYNYWDFPKGKIEVGERVIDAAIRETKEESGIDELVFSWGRSHTQTPAYGPGKKVAYYFLAQTNQKNVVMQINEELGKAEHDEYRWMSFVQAYPLVVPRIKEVLDWAKDKISTVAEKKAKKRINTCQI